MAPLKKRILFILPLPPPVHGSAVVSQMIHDSLLINSSFLCDYVNLSSSRTISEVGVFTLKKFLRTIQALFETGWKLLTHKYDLCYIALTCHGRGFLKDAPFALLCKLFHRPLVIHQHNKGMASDIGRWPYRWLLPLVYKNTGVILLSQALYPDIAAVVPEKNIMICPNGISDISPSARSKSPECPVVELLFISNLIASKGVYDLIDACRLLKEEGKSFHCRIIGSESNDILRSDLENAIQKANLCGFVNYEGPLYGKQKIEALNNADIFVFPTYYSEECFPLCLLEAMRHALPIVTTEEGGIPDMVQHGNNGLICNKKDPEALADALSALIADPTLRIEMGRRGRELFESHFTPYHFEYKMVECLNKSLHL